MRIFDKAASDFFEASFQHKLLPFRDRHDAEIHKINWAQPTLRLGLHLAEFKQFRKEFVAARVDAYIETCKKIGIIPEASDYEEFSKELIGLAHGGTEQISRVYRDPLGPVKAQTEEHVLEVLETELGQLVSPALNPLRLYMAEGKLTPSRNVQLNEMEAPKERSSMAKDIFISHSNGDEDIALAIIELLHTAANVPREAIRCTSVDGYRLPIGADTDELLRSEVKESKFFIGLITPASMSSAYVLFELGARWGAGLQLAPVLARGANNTLLRGPLVGLNALDCSSESQMHQLAAEVGSFLSYTLGSPALYDRYVKKLVSISREAAQIGNP